MTAVAPEPEREIDLVMGEWVWMEDPEVMVAMVMKTPGAGTNRLTRVCESSQTRQTESLFVLRKRPAGSGSSHRGSGCPSPITQT